VSYDPTTAKEMLLMAPSVEEQQFWVSRLLKRIQKSGFKAEGHVSNPPTPPPQPTSTNQICKKSVMQAVFRIRVLCFMVTDPDLDPSVIK
jgi:hypothetical protein